MMFWGMGCLVREGMVEIGDWDEDGDGDGDSVEKR